jgi:hypothetical protein
MKTKIQKNGQFLVMIIALSFLVTIGWTLDANAEALLVQAQGSQGFAAPGNREPANFLVVVTGQLTGGPVTNLDQPDFAIINHFSLPWAKCGFSSQIISFTNVGTGAYQIQVGLPANIPGCTWVRGNYLAQVIVSSGLDRGQTAVTLSIKSAASRKHWPDRW